MLQVHRNVTLRPRKAGLSGGKTSNKKGLTPEGSVLNVFFYPAGPEDQMRPM